MQASTFFCHIYNRIRGLVGRWVGRSWRKPCFTSSMRAHATWASQVAQDVLSNPQYGVKVLAFQCSKFAAAYSAWQPQLVMHKPAVNSSASQRSSISDGVVSSFRPTLNDITRLKRNCTVAPGMALHCIELH